MTLKDEVAQLREINARYKRGLEAFRDYSCYPEDRKRATLILDLNEPLREYLPETNNTPESML